MILKENAVVPIIQEFYASLWDQEFRNTEGHMWDMVLVRGKEVRVSLQIICNIYNVLYYDNDFIDEIDLEYFPDIDMDSIINFLTGERGEWKYHAGTNITIIHLTCLSQQIWNKKKRDKIARRMVEVRRLILKRMI
ncbi:hypothetical protein Goshw_020986, partial [Gossypium schwendimanii]|nr:hypothetical protein [Gossypium schwendimanii]